MRKGDLLRGARVPGRTPHDARGGDCSDVLASQVMPTIAEHHQKLEEVRKDSVQSLRGSVSPTDIFLLDFEPPELRQNFLLF